jgi:hypothetical protein
VPIRATGAVPAPRAPPRSDPDRPTAYNEVSFRRVVIPLRQAVSVRRMAARRRPGVRRVWGRAPMTEPALPAEVRALIRGPLATIAHVEALLLLRRMAPSPVSTDAVATEAQLPTPAAARRCLEELIGAGLAEGAGKDMYRYAPARPEAGAAVDALARMYNEKPVTLVRAVYARPAGPVQAFADAFRLRRDEEDGT